ncbi:hypothetical protein N9E48_08275 [Paracoccaceae bacterium]|nr:hypothetical protein [Paracoccaceae bacterium]
MQVEPENIPQYILTFFNEVNEYIDVLPTEFRLKLTDYMHLVAWQITQDLSDGLPDEHFRSIKGRFQEAKNTVLH